MSSWSTRATRLATVLLATLAVLLSMALPVSAAGRSAETKLGVQQPVGAESGNPDPDHPVSVYYTAIPLDPGKTVQFITLPTNLNLHVFAMAIG